MRQCPHCNGTREECADPEKVWHMHYSICHKTVALEAARRLQAEEYKDAQWHDGTHKKWAKEYSPEFPFKFSDGLSVWVSDQPQSATDAG